MFTVWPAGNRDRDLTDASAKFTPIRYILAAFTGGGEMRNPTRTVDPSSGRRYCVLVKRKFHVTLLEHDEGVSVSCPELPGCHSQGTNVEEALENIEDAIRGYIDLYGEPETRCEIREMEVVTA